MLASPGYSVRKGCRRTCNTGLLSCTSRCTIRVRMLVGYATVSTGAQSLQAQMAAPKRSWDAATVSAPTRDLLNLPTAGSTRPARDAQGRLVVNILASISEFECELIHARMTEGRKRAVANGVKFGPKFKLNSFQKQEALARLAAGESQSVIAKTMASTPLRFRACKGRRLAKTKTLSCAVPSPHVAAQGKAPDRPRHQGLPRPCVGDPGGELLGRTQPNKSAHGVPVPSGPSPSDGRPQPTPPRHALLRAVGSESTWSTPGGHCAEALRPVLAELAGPVASGCGAGAQRARHHDCRG